MALATPKTRQLIKGLIGRSFGRLTVTGIGAKPRQVVCRCECGAETSVLASNLLSSATRSCGCLLLERLAQTRNGLPAGANRVMRSYKWNAKSRGLDWGLTDDQVLELLTSSCHYCGQLPSQVRRGRRSSFSYNGIDRVDSSHGYSLTNCVASCGICNRMKLDLSSGEFLAHIKRISLQQETSCLSR